MMTKDQQEHLSVSLQEDIALIYKTVYQLPKGDKRDIVLLMLAILRSNVRKGLGTTERIRT